MTATLRWLGSGLAAIALEAVAVHLFVRGAPLPLPLLLHALAALVCTLAVPRDLPVYRDAMLVGTLAVPVLGPALGWLLLRPSARAAINAHAFFDNYEDEVGAAVEIDRIESDALGASMSFHEVLRHGSLDHRRNALRKLAERGQPIHLALLRRCLSHKDMELRLGAFRELNRLLERREAQLADVAAAAAATPADPAACMRLARAHRDYAGSGLLDREMQRLQLELALAASRSARQLAPQDAAIAVEQTMIFIALEDFAGAERTLATVRRADADRPEVCVARAHLAFRMRRFSIVAAERERLAAAAQPVPAWMRELEAVS